MVGPTRDFRRDSKFSLRGASQRSRIVLHVFRPTPRVVNGSPACLKLETFLRMAKLGYRTDTSRKASSKGKMPWMELDGEAVADSNFCIRLLNKELGVDVDSELSEAQRSIAHCILTTLEENTYWTIVYYRWLSKDAKIVRDFVLGKLPPLVKSLVFRKIQKRIRSQLHGHGIGRHTEEELYGIAERDLRAVSKILGDKTFLFESQRPCLADAALFALVASCVWDCPRSPQAKLIKEELTNLERHAQNMRELLFPDWDEIIRTRGRRSQKREHTKRPHFS